MFNPHFSIGQLGSTSVYIVMDGKTQIWHPLANINILAENSQNLSPNKLDPQSTSCPDFY